MAPRPSPSRPLTRRLPIALAAGALAVATAVTPAFAADDPSQSSDQGNWSQQSGGNGNGHNAGATDQQSGGNGDNTGHGDQQSGGNGNSTGSNQQHAAGGNHGDQGQYRGRVTASKLALRTAPNRGAHIIRYAHRGEVVSIFCKVPGDKVNGNPLWYLLTDGTWAWGPAGHIDNIGPAPRWC
ncbi:SH3 domain-containing protein [Streptomyces sp. CHD11]|uniref:SH3 domain-containing protein n=1 Tax=Streptomyces sp. CHD11 TaxID=2741325 RepID=UPI001BFCCA5D|nr:SH3 domain-containing protein [Streptomyces sp. CHD11]MBT3153388.1 SH3 domain-containing protein [Streptomyces sp. CHD11]